MEYVLQMPAVSFYAFLKQSRMELGREGVHAADLSVIPLMQFEYYKSLRRSYQELMLSPTSRKPAHIPTPDAAFDWGNPVTQAMIHNLFRQHRKSRYGH